MKAPAPPAPVRLGWCRVGAAPWSHDRCAGGTDANPGRVWHPCPCTCHQPEETTVTEAPLSMTEAADRGMVTATPAAPVAVPADPLAAALTQLEDATTALNEAYAGKVDPTELLIHLHRLRQITRELGVIDSLMVHDLYLRAEHGKRVIDGIGEVWIGRNRDRRRWDGPALAQAVIDARMEARGGELPEDPMTVAEWLLEVIPVERARVTPLRDLGIEPRDLCEDLPGNVSVTLPKAD